MQKSRDDFGEHNAGAFFGDGRHSAGAFWIFKLESALAQCDEVLADKTVSLKLRRKFEAQRVKS